MDSKLVNEENHVQHDKKVALMKRNDETRSWAELPSEILDMIFSHLFEFDHLSFHLTCKTWQSSVSFSSIYATIQKFPWLMSYAKPQSHGVFSFFNPISNQTYVMKIPKLAGAYFRCSRYGWLLMSKGKESLFFYNPFIPNSTIKLPDRDCDCVSMSFTAPPTSPDCIVFGHEFSRLESVVTYIWAYGEDKWTEFTVDCQLPFNTSLCTPCFYKDVFYYIDVNGRLGVLDVMGSDKNHQKLTWNDLLQPSARDDIITRCHIKNYIAECDGQLVLVFVGNNGDPIHVFELDWSQMEWVKVQSLGNKAMFIGETGSLLVKMNVSGGENKIYFPRFINKKGYGKSDAARDGGVYYCIATGKYHAFQSEFSSGDWVGTRGVSKYAWIEPNFNTDDWFRYMKNRRP